MQPAPLRIGRVFKKPPTQMQATETISKAMELGVKAPLPAKKPKRTPVLSKAAQPDGGMQDYWGRLIRLIPAEVLSIYLVGIGMIPVGVSIATAIWALICLGLVVVARAYLTGDKPSNIPPEWTSVAISSVSFVIWVYNMPGPFQAYGLAVPYIGSLAVLVWTFIVPAFYKGKDVTYGGS